MWSNFSLVLLLVLSLFGFSPIPASAQPVGHFLQVTGPVELLKNGSLPAIMAKTQDGVEKNDTIYTKTQSKAMVKFVDDSLLTIAPETRVSIEDYLYDASKNKRQAVLMLIKGVVHSVVTRLLKTDKPDWQMITETSVVGVRGTEWYTIADSKNQLTDVFNQSGSLAIRSSSSGVTGDVVVTPMQATRILRNQSPSPPIAITMNDLRILRGLMNTGLPTRGTPGAGPRERLEDIAALGTTGQNKPPTPLNTPPRLPDRVSAGFSKPSTPAPPQPAPQPAPQAPKPTTSYPPTTHSR